jgi:hypothetical protein
MTIESCLCFILVSFFIGFIIELLRGKFKIQVTKNKDISQNNLPNRRPPLIRDLYRPRPVLSGSPNSYREWANGGSYARRPWPQYDRSSRARRNNTSNPNNTSVFDPELPTYQDSTNAADSRDLN